MSRPANCCPSTPATPSFADAFGEAAAAREAEIRELAKQAGTPLYDVSTEDDLVRALVRMVESRKRQRR